MKELLKSIYYYFLNLLTFKKGIKVNVNNFILRLPARYYKYFPQDYEKENFIFFKKVYKQGFTSIDVGAHIGIFSIYMQKLTGGKVYSFEPTPGTITVLKQTIELNNAVEKIEIVEAAVSDKSGKALLNIDPQPVSVSNSLVQYERTANLQQCEVEIISLDDFVSKRGLKIDFIKMDAEGAELDVLKGAHHTLATQHPIIILALHPSAISARNETTEMIWLYLKERNYIISYNGYPISKEEFSMKTELFDVHLVPIAQD